MTFQPADIIQSYEVNERHKQTAYGRGKIESEIRKDKREPQEDPLGSYYQGRFLERWRETGGFGPSDAINILAEDSWEIATSYVRHEIPYIIFKRPRGSGLSPVLE